MTSHLAAMGRMESSGVAISITGAEFDVYERLVISTNQSPFVRHMTLTLKHSCKKQSSEQDKQGTKCTYSCPSNNIYISVSMCY